MSRVRRFARSASMLLSAGVRGSPGWMVIGVLLQIVGGLCFAIYPYGKEPSSTDFTNLGQLVEELRGSLEPAKACNIT